MQPPRIVIGLGAGQCGFRNLQELLRKQPQSRVTMEDRPLLPWYPEDPKQLITERFQRWLEQSKGTRFVADVAAFYLPYVQSAIEAAPGVRFVCLKATREDVVTGFTQLLDRGNSVPTNHWCQEPPPGWYHDPLWSRTFPKYATTNRQEGIERYWQEYYAGAEELAARYPEHFRIWNRDALESDQGVTEILDFIEMPAHLRVHHVMPGDRPETARGAPKVALDPMSPKRCVILVPFGLFIHQDCDHPLKELEKRGYQVRRVGGYAAIDQGRNQMATDALLDGFTETLWIDSDIGFHPDDVEKLRRHNLPISCGIYPQKGKRALACHVGMNMQRLTFGSEGGLTEILYAGAGFLHIRRQVYLDVQSKLDLPVANERFGAPMIPFFYPMIRKIEDGHWYLAEDYAFCERVRRCGYKIMADSTIRLWHVGNYRYGWEDAGMERPRFGSFTMSFRDTVAPVTESQENASNDLTNFVSQFQWPSVPLEVESPPDRAWLLPAVRQALADTVRTDDRLIVEVGCWVGRRTRYIADLAPTAKIIAIDPWSTTPVEGDDRELAAMRPEMFNHFVAECWDYRQQVIPVRRPYVEGLRQVIDSRLMPDMVLLDCPDAEFETTLRVVLEAFPKTTVVGHRFDRAAVGRVLQAASNALRLRLESLDTAWRIIRK